MAAFGLHCTCSSASFRPRDCKPRKAASVSSILPTRRNPSSETPPELSSRHTTFLVDSFHQNQSLKALLSKLRREDSDPLQLLKDDGDWNKQHFWAVTKYLKETSRMQQALQVFDYWKDLEKSRINELNYTKIIEMLGSEGLMAEAVSVLQEMTGHSLRAPVEIYNAIIHGYARKGDFETASFFLKKMVQDNLVPEPETYDGLIQAYGDHNMYDEMCKCVKRVELEGCYSDHVTYNILIRAFAKGGLLGKMEEVHSTLRSKKMSLQPSTLVAMLEGYADLGVVEKMENFYHRILNSDAHLNEGTVRKMARVYIQSHMFSRLEDLALTAGRKIGKTDLIWCLLLLSSACLLSYKGMDSVISKMEVSSTKLNITCMNSIALALLKMKDFRRLDTLLFQLQSVKLKPDIVTVGIAYDAYKGRLQRNKVIEKWSRKGFLKEEAILKTDPLVLTAFGKGFFLKSCEELYTAVGSRWSEKKVWTYEDLTNLVTKLGKATPLTSDKVQMYEI